jgi:2-polyprenyl-3-methyl-5-hydroxy-6-metoxy-1,4-benzoquinol methylase
VSPSETIAQDPSHTDSVRACPFCGSTDVAEDFQARELVVGTRESYDYRRCAGCNAIYLADGSLDLSTLYPENYLAFGDPARASLLTLYDRSLFVVDAVRWLAILRRFGARVTKTTRIADVGCGDGSLLRAMHSLGLRDLTGIDPYVPERVSVPGVRILRENLDDFVAKSDERFDVVMFHHSLEHVLDPGAFLRRAIDMLTPDGVIFVRLPVVNLAWELYREAWWNLSAPQHVSLPSERSMRALAERNGLKMRGVVYDSNRMQFVVSEAHKQDRSRYEAFPSNPLHKIRVAATTMHLWLRARRLNARGLGDQAAFVLERA